MVALDPSFRKLQLSEIMPSYQAASKRMILCDYDGTLVPSNQVQAPDSCCAPDSFNTLPTNRASQHLATGSFGAGQCEHCLARAPPQGACLAREALAYRMCPQHGPGHCQP